MHADDASNYVPLVPKAISLPLEPPPQPKFSYIRFKEDSLGTNFRSNPFNFRELGSARSRSA